MATAKTKAKATKKKAAKRKTGEERKSTPKLTSCPFVADLTRPHSTKSSGNIAQKAQKVAAAVESWKNDVRTARAAGTAAPEFPASKFADPNIGQLSVAAFDKLTGEFEDAIENGTKLPAMYPRYNPVQVELIHAMNCPSLRRTATQTEPPNDWDEKAYGPWHHEYEDENGKVTKEPSGWRIDPTMPRRCHAETAEKMIDNPEKNILTFGNLRVVCGTGTHDGSAVFIVNQTSHGNYLAGDITRKRMSFAGIKEVRNVVFKIEDRSNNGGGFTVKGKWDSIDEMVYLPGQVLTAGFLSDSKGNQLDAKAIRGLDADTKGLRFKALAEPIVGKPIHWSKLWAEIKIVSKDAVKKMRERGGRSLEYEAGDVETKAITNFCVNAKRVDPGEAFPFGLRGSQCHMPAFIVASGEGKIEEGHFLSGVVIGARANAPYNVGVQAAKPKKVVKPKAEKKSEKPTDAAPPVESDTADEKVDTKVTVAVEE